MSNPFSGMPLGSRIFIATSITVTLLFAAAGWGLQQYTIAQSDENVRAEIQASIQAYEAVWKARTEVLSATSALMSGMSDVRAAFLTRDPQTIRDSAQDLWSRVSDASALFFVLDAQGHLLSSLGRDSKDLPVDAIPLRQAASSFPRQLAGYVRNGAKLFYVVLTPVYVQTSTEPILLNILCAGFRIDGIVAGQMKQLGPRSDFAFLAHGIIFASTLDPALSQSLSETTFAAGSNHIWKGAFIVSYQPLRDIAGLPVAQLFIVRSYASEIQALGRLRRSLGLAWLLTIAVALLVSSYATRQLLKPIKLLDQATSEVASGNYLYRVPVSGNDELARLSATFNQMCQSIQQAQADLIRQEQISTIGRLGSSLVHDLRNPLAAIYGGAELLVDGQLAPDNTRRVAMNIHRACERVQELLRDLLNASRGGSGDLDFFRLLEIIEAATDSMDAQSSGVHLSLSVDEAIEVFGERSRLERVFTNLLLNALEAMPAGGSVTIRSASLDHGVGVFVQDSGPGISPEMQPELFRPFVTGKRSGLGLGLALSRQTMRDFGGDLSATLPDNGSGACFCVYFSKIRRP